MESKNNLELNIPNNSMIDTYLHFRKIIRTNSHQNKIQNSNNEIKIKLNMSTKIVNKINLEVGLELILEVLYLSNLYLIFLFLFNKF